MTMTLRTADESVGIGSAEVRRLSLLYLAGAESPPEWLNRALRAESGSENFQITEVMSLAALLEQLRDAPYDVCLVDEDASDRSAGELIGAIRSGAHDHQAIIILTDAESRRRATEYLAAGAAAYLSIPNTTSAELVCHLQRAADAARTASELERLRGLWEQRVHQDQQSIQNLLRDEQAIIDLSQAASRTDARQLDDVIMQRLRPACRNLLEAYLLLGREELAADVHSFSTLLRESQFPLTCLLQDYLGALAALVADRGVRSARHVLDRGHLLMLEILLSWTGRADS